MIISVAGQKGGSGKSTIAIHLAAEWHARGKKVLLADADPQGTALTWAEVAAEKGVSCPHVVAVGDNLRTVLPALSENYDVTLIDVPGRKASKRQVGALVISDVALLPCGPSTPDVWALAESVELVNEVRDLRSDLKAAVVINRRTATSEGKSARAALGSSTLPVLKTEIGLRVAFSEALAAGLGVTLYASGTVAANEIRRLADEVEDLALSDAEGVDAA